MFNTDPKTIQLLAIKEQIEKINNPDVIVLNKKIDLLIEELAEAIELFDKRISGLENKDK